MTWLEKPLNVLLALISGLFFAALTIPIVALIVRGFSSEGWTTLPASGISEAMYLSLVTTTISTLAIVAFGTPLAYILARWDFKLRRFVVIVVQLPIVLPPAVAGLALLVTFGRRGVFGQVLEDIGLTIAFTTLAVIFAQTFVAAPFYIRAASVGFQSVPREVEEAAMVDGASGFGVFWWVTLPVAMRSLAAGVTLSWSRAMGEFGATILFAGSLQGRTQTMPLLIYNVLEQDLDAAIVAGLLLVLLALLALLFVQWLLPADEQPVI